MYPTATRKDEPHSLKDFQLYKKESCVVGIQGLSASMQQYNTIKDTVSWLFSLSGPEHTTAQQAALGLNSHARC